MQHEPLKSSTQTHTVKLSSKVTQTTTFDRHSTTLSNVQWAPQQMSVLDGDEMQYPRHHLFIASTRTVSGLSTKKNNQASRDTITVTRKEPFNMLVHTVTYRVNMFVSTEAEFHVRVSCSQRFFSFFMLETRETHKMRHQTWRDQIQVDRILLSLAGGS